VVTDKPRYNFRAVMIDTARHWYNVEVILQHLDAMAYAKMNVMHWHVVDSDAFPFQSTTFPEMSMTGAYSPNHIYTHSDIRTVVEYALARGM
jgi:hexosaminidase